MESDNDQYSTEVGATIKRAGFSCAWCSYWRPKEQQETDQSMRGRCIFGAPNYSLIIPQSQQYLLLGGSAAPVVVTYWRETLATDACSEWQMVGSETQGFVAPMGANN